MIWLIGIWGSEELNTLSLNLKTEKRFKTHRMGRWLDERDLSTRVMNAV